MNKNLHKLGEINDKISSLVRIHFSESQKQKHQLKSNLLCKNSESGPLEKQQTRVFLSFCVNRFKCCFKSS